MFTLFRNNYALFSKSFLNPMFFAGDNQWVRPQISILNFSRYCRFRAAQKRLSVSGEDSARHTLHLSVLAGVAMTSQTRVFFCREHVDHPMIQESMLQKDHLSKNSPSPPIPTKCSHVLKLSRIYRKKLLGKTCPSEFKSSRFMLNVCFNFFVPTCCTENR